MFTRGYFRTETGRNVLVQKVPYDSGHIYVLHCHIARRQLGDSDKVPIHIHTRPGKHPKNDGKTLFLMAKSTISMAILSIFNSYFDITRGYPYHLILHVYTIFMAHICGPYGTSTGAGATLQTDDLMAVATGPERWQDRWGIPGPRHSRQHVTWMWWLATMLRLKLQVRHRVEQQT